MKTKTVLYQQLEINKTVYGMISTSFIILLLYSDSCLNNTVYINPIIIEMLSLKSNSPLDKHVIKDTDNKEKVRLDKRFYCTTPIKINGGNHHLKVYSLHFLLHNHNQAY